MDLRPCEVCGEQLSPAEAESSLCRFHVGTFASPSDTASAASLGRAAGFGRWRCCGEEGAAARGCAAGVHLLAPEAAREASCGARGGAEEEAPPSEPGFALVLLGPADTLQGLALRYNTSPEAILAANNLTTSGFAFGAKKVLRIPGAVGPGLVRRWAARQPPLAQRPASGATLTSDPQAPSRRVVVERLAAAAGATRGTTVTQEEAAAYLDLAGGDVRAALQELCGDAEWAARVSDAFIPESAAAPTAMAAALEAGSSLIRTSITAAFSAAATCVDPRLSRPGSTDGRGGSGALLESLGQRVSLDLGRKKD